MWGFSFNWAASHKLMVHGSKSGIGLEKKKEDYRHLFKTVKTRISVLYVVLTFDVWNITMEIHLSFIFIQTALRKYFKFNYLGFLNYKKKGEKMQFMMQIIFKYVSCSEILMLYSLWNFQNLGSKLLQRLKITDLLTFFSFNQIIN